MSAQQSVHRMLHHFKRSAISASPIRERHFQQMMRMSKYRVHIQNRSRYRMTSTFGIYSNTVPRIMHKQRIQYIYSRNCSSSTNGSKESSQNPSNRRNEKEEEEEEGPDYGYFRMMPRFRNIHHWDKFEWIFSFSSLVQFLGFLSYDYMLLRVLSLLSASGMMIAHTGRRFFVGWFWALSFAVANIVALWYMLREKYSADLGGLNEEEEFIYHRHFEPFGITPLEYKQIVKIGQFVSMQRGETLTVHGLVSENMFLLLEGQCIVINQEGDRLGVIDGGSKKSFIGEIALIDDTQDEATATVETASEECRLLVFDVDEMKYFLRNTKAELRVKLTNVFTSSMKLKLLAFNESVNMEKSIRFNQEALESMVKMLLISKEKIEILDSDENGGKQNNFKFLISDQETITLSVEEQVFLRQYIDQKQINDQFVQKLITEYHISSDL